LQGETFFSLFRRLSRSLLSPPILFGDVSGFPFLRDWRVWRISERGAEEMEGDVIGLEWEREVERRGSLVLAAVGRSFVCWP
jgi:hypothetical protein